MIALEDIKLETILPQRYPFLMIDRITEFEPGKSLTAVKYITGNEWVYKGDGFPTTTFPETLLIEAAAQAGLAFYQLGCDDPSKKIAVYIGKVKAEFHQSASISDAVQLKIIQAKIMHPNSIVDVDLSVDRKNIAHVQLFVHFRN